MLVWLNGEFVERDDARVSAFDAGFQHGVGLFETMRAANGRIFRPHAHLQRLLTSSRELHLTERLQLEPMAEALQLVLQRNEMDDARVRLSLTGGDLNMLQQRAESVADPTLLIVPQPPTPYPDEFFTNGVRTMIAHGRENPLDTMAGHKTLNYWPRIHALQIAGQHQASEALWFTVSNHLSSGSVSNIFLVKNEQLMTPIARDEEREIAGEAGAALPSTVLPGVTRSAVMDLAQGMRIGVERRMLDIEDLLGADEVFLTNSSWGVLPVIGVEQETIADGNVGPLTTELRQRYLALVEEETTS